MVEAPDGIPSEFCKLFLTIAVSDWEEMVAHLPEDHDLRARLASRCQMPSGSATRQREAESGNSGRPVYSGRPVTPRSARRLGQYSFIR